MKKILLAGITIAAAGLFGIISANAAPVEYVKVCDAYGPGFWGTMNACIKPYVGVQGGFGSSNTIFDVMPGFNVYGTGTVWDVNAGILTGIQGTSISLGPSISFYGGQMGGSTFYPTSGNDYSVKTRSVTTVDVQVGFGHGFPTGFASGGPGVVDWTTAFGSFTDIIYVKLGAAFVSRDVSCSCGASDSSKTTGFTAAIGVSKQIANTPISLTAEWRHTGLARTFVFVPGMVPESGHINTIMFGAQLTLGDWSPSPDRYASDARLKRDVHLLATLENGLKIYSFKYLWADTAFVGVMAQDLLRNPAWSHAVVAMPSGFYAVDYGALGLKMVTLEEWQAQGLAAIKSGERLSMTEKEPLVLQPAL